MLLGNRSFKAPERTTALERTASSSVLIGPPYLQRLPLLHRELAAVPGYEVVGAAVDSLGLWWEAAGVSEREGDRRRYQGVGGRKSV